MEYYTYFLLFKGQETKVEEPIGWDSFECKLARSEDYHGISAEYTELTVKFDDPVAMDLIKAAYEEDIDNIITFISRYEGIEEYKGQLDLSVYKEVHEKYRYIEVAITEIDVRVKFRSRFETKVNLDSATAFDGAVLTPYPHLKFPLTMPGKGIEMAGSCMSDHFIPYNNFAITSGYNAFLIPFGDVEINEIKTLTPRNEIDRYQNPNVTSYATFFTNEFDPESELACSDGKYNLTMSGSFGINYVEGTRPNSIEMALGVYRIRSGGSDLLTETVLYRGSFTNYIPFSFENVNFEELSLNQGDKLTAVIFMGITGDSGSNPLKLNLTAYSTNMRITSLSLCGDIQANVTFVHEAFARIAEAITNNEISVKSDYYGRIDSDVNPTQYNGQLLTITNGLRIRNYTDTELNEPEMTMSFKGLMDGLIPIDNIGYGFIRENGILTLRVENYEWFYKDQVVFTINNPATKTRSIIPKEIPSIFKIGYKKYETEGTNGLDAIMTEREYRTRQILTDTKIEKITEFVGDSYAIEATRRRAFDKNTVDWRYDNDIFIVKVKSDNGYIVDLGVYKATGVISPDTLYNADITPARCAKKWLSRLFGWSNKLETLFFSSGTGNINASTSREVFVISGVPHYIYVKENEDMLTNMGFFKPETLEVEYPLTLSEYQIIKNNPYGTIVVDGEECYLKELKYKRKSRMGNFILIPKFIV